MKPPWWLVPNLIALDAPLVAVVWQRFLAAAFGVPLPAAPSVVLALVVWGVYLLDRLWDARRGDAASDRHRLAAAYPTAFLLAAVAALSGAAVGVWFLPAEVLRAGVAVALGVAGYLGLVHLVAPFRLWKAGLKELLVGVGFAAGVTIPEAASGLPPADWWPTAVAFGCLCWLNCRLIDRWEAAAPVGFLELGIASAAIALSLASPLRVAGAVAAGVGLLAVVHLLSGRRPRPARVLADAVLLTPLLVWG